MVTGGICGDHKLFISSDDFVARFLESINTKVTEDTRVLTV